jgi:hypothetical protein
VQTTLYLHTLYSRHFVMLAAPKQSEVYMYSTSKDAAVMAEYSMVYLNELGRKRPRSPCLDFHEIHQVEKPSKRQKLELDCTVVTPRPRPQQMTYPSPSPLQLNSYGPSTIYTHHNPYIPQSVNEPNVYVTGLKWAKPIPSETIDPGLIEPRKSSTPSAYSELTSLSGYQDFPGTFFSRRDSFMDSSPALQFQSTPPIKVSDDSERSRNLLAMEEALATRRQNTDLALAMLQNHRAA